MENPVLTTKSHIQNKQHPTETPRKTKFFFILGRNPELSRAEILEFLKARSRPHKEILFQGNILILETNEGERFNIQEFGGTMHLGEITFEGNQSELKTYLNKTEIVPSDKFSYAIHGNLDPQIIKEKFKSLHKKASQKHGKKTITYQDGHKEESPKADFHIFFHSANSEATPKRCDITGDSRSHSEAVSQATADLTAKQSQLVYLGLATQTYDPKEVEFRDMQKPVRRESLAISPRLSKILINLSGAKPYDKLLDPFCGIGGILLEALIKRINVHGIDKDAGAIKDAQKNLDWITSQYKIQTKYTIENNDSRKTPDLQFNAIATETPLGKILTKKPSDNQAKQIIQNFEAYIIPILIRLKKVKKPSAKIAITFPVIRDIHVNVQKILEKSNLLIYLQPILESRKDQFISRDILVLQ